MTTELISSAAEIKNRLAGLGNIQIKKMFGGYGIFEEHKMFALIDNNGDVFFKSDASNQLRFEQAGAVRHARMPYFNVPAEVLENDNLLEEWALESIRVAKAV